MRGLGRPPSLQTSALLERLRGVLQTFRPEVVFHAAAHKHQISEVLMDNTSDLRPTSIEKIKAINTGAFAFEVFAQRVRALERSAWEVTPIKSTGIWQI